MGLAGRQLCWESALCQAAGTPAQCQVPAAARRALAMGDREGTTCCPLHQSLLSGLSLRQGSSTPHHVANSQEALQSGYSSLRLQTLGNQFSLFIN